LLTMRRELRQILDDLGVGTSSPGGMPAVTAKETDALNALDRDPALRDHAQRPDARGRPGARRLGLHPDDPRSS